MSPRRRLCCACIASALALHSAPARAFGLAGARLRPLALAARGGTRALRAAGGGGGGGGDDDDDEPADTSAAHAREVVSLHRQIADSTAPSAPGSSAARDGSAAAHIARQAAVFDEASAFFASDAACPEDVKPRLARIARLSGLQPGDSAVDVGCGTGALVPFLARECGVSLADLVGVDVSAKMLAVCAERHAPMRTACADVVAWAEAEARAGRAGAHRAVFFNACFGNMHDQRAALRAASIAAAPDGARVLVTHPLGRAFVERLRAEDPSVVPHGVPGSAEEARALAEGLPLRLLELHDEPDAPEPPRGGGGEGGGGAPAAGFYACVFEQWRPRALPRVRLLRGAVAEGYGRGSRKLGIPTANLKESAFAGALRPVPTGVYFGWAVVEGAEGAAGGAVHRAVVNVGYSPTFAGAENAEKIVEAHLVPPDSGRAFGPDFYGRPMRLLLCGQVRPEKKFDGFATLLANIQQDVRDSVAALGEEPFAAFARDPFLVAGLPSDGAAGLAPGDEVPAIFEEVDFALALSAARAQRQQP